MVKNPEGSEDTTAPAKRLCSEIQLFDLCELETCRLKDGRFCTSEDLLTKFESIKEDEDNTAELFISDEQDEFEGDDERGYEEDAEYDEEE